MLPKNLIFVRRVIGVRILILFFIIAIPLYILNPIFLYSVALGLMFSFLVFNQMLVTQSVFLRRKQKGYFYVSYLFRLAIYACPLIVGLYFKNYFNFIIILVSLLCFQFYYIWIEFFRSLKKIKRQ